MSLFKLDSKIYGAWNVDREDGFILNGKALKISSSQYDQKTDNSNTSGGNSKYSKKRHYVKKILTLKFQSSAIK